MPPKPPHINIPNPSRHLPSSPLKPQTVTSSTIQNSSISSSTSTENYPNGPICVLNPNLYLYSEPTLKELYDFSVIINVAEELTNYSQLLPNSIDYYFIPWSHNSHLFNDFQYLTSIIDKSLKANKKILIHCQCGVSRSASLIIAYYMKFYNLNYNDAYNRLKEIVPQISPNLNLIYELIEWGDFLNS
ncbi:tyrosine/serine/threonine protein phosphatase [Pichia kluyveri]|uniref:protein-tyrosine-phosphatase n=1 Tax=Pichia kluyveri TaxID=36015 RepID=A0AAV5RAC9_PICKL|nr:tyrosine/serine/threonine protein phosphatase [Pichia kluyveri]